MGGHTDSVEDYKHANCRASCRRTTPTRSIRDQGLNFLLSPPPPLVIFERIVPPPLLHRLFNSPPIWINAESIVIYEFLNFLSTNECVFLNVVHFFFVFVLQNRYWCFNFTIVSCFNIDTSFRFTSLFIPNAYIYYYIFIKRPSNYAGIISPIISKKEKKKQFLSTSLAAQDIINMFFRKELPSIRVPANSNANIPGIKQRSIFPPRFPRERRTRWNRGEKNNCSFAPSPLARVSLDINDTQTSLLDVDFRRLRRETRICLFIVRVTGCRPPPCREQRAKKRIGRRVTAVPTSWLSLFHDYKKEDAPSSSKTGGGSSVDEEKEGRMGRRRWWLGWWWSDRCTISGEQSRISNPPRCRMLERGWVAGLPVYPSSWFSQRCKSIHIPGRKLCLSRWKKYLRRRRRRGECLCRGGRGWRKVIWILIKLLRWFRWLLKQVCFGVDSGYESAERVWMSLYGNTMIDFDFRVFPFPFIPLKF